MQFLVKLSNRLCYNFIKFIYSPLKFDFRLSSIYLSSDTVRFDQFLFNHILCVRLEDRRSSQIRSLCSPDEGDRRWWRQWWRPNVTCHISWLRCQSSHKLLFQFLVIMFETKSADYSVDKPFIYIILLIFCDFIIWISG